MSSSTTFNTIGLPFIHLNTVESSNTFLLDKLRNGLAAHGTAVFADEQTAGKGQMGKVWKSEIGQNIILSLAIDVSFIPLNNQFCISVMVALGCYQFFSKYAGEETKIKWPNDIYWKERKAGGILIETMNRKNSETRNKERSDIRFAVVGIGLNINQTVFGEGIKNPVSLKQITGKQFNVVDLAKELCVFIEKEYLQLQKGKQAKQLIKFNNILFKHNERVKLKKNQIVFSCVIKGVDEYGKLLVQHPAYESFNLHEVEWIL
ncbi:MAG: biotin--[acetyl-CoA-carboxylase] ligase [Bacteroidetes bacterium]|nr:biotin--[acetyl-CoA-carboxylase] ligase [Bacteroidota bacterium]MBS1649417.1 biotin--[acetyl-CoA-carboxylase] ligase [Bacteroidota bacterium]